MVVDMKNGSSLSDIYYLAPQLTIPTIISRVTVE